jgi:hypothetical protein
MDVRRDKFSKSSALLFISPHTPIVGPGASSRLFSAPESSRMRKRHILHHSAQKQQHRSASRKFVEFAALGVNQFAPIK